MNIDKGGIVKKAVKDIFANDGDFGVITRQDYNHFAGKKSVFILWQTGKFSEYFVDGGDYISIDMRTNALDDIDLSTDSELTKFTLSTLRKDFFLKLLNDLETSCGYVAE